VKATDCFKIIRLDFHRIPDTVIKRATEELFTGSTIVVILINRVQRRLLFRHNVKTCS